MDCRSKMRGMSSLRYCGRGNRVQSSVIPLVPFQFMTPTLVKEKAFTAFDTLSEKIENRTARIGIVGLGYVGLPLAVEFATAGFDVTGLDVSVDKIAQLMSGVSYIQDV